MVLLAVLRGLHFVSTLHPSATAVLGPTWFTRLNPSAAVLTSTHARLFRAFSASKNRSFDARGVLIRLFVAVGSFDFVESRQASTAAAASCVARNVRKKVRFCLRFETGVFDPCIRLRKNRPQTSEKDTLAGAATKPPHTTFFIFFENLEL